MATIELRSVSHSYGQKAAPCASAAANVLENLDLIWEDGTANALLGPSGCGKTTVLNIISGLLRPSSGSVLIDGKLVTDRSPRERRIAQVFQFPVVYDTMSVFENLAFPLRNSRVPAAAVRRRVETVAEILELTGILRTPAGRLSQAEKQKVSLGRGIAREDTAAILLDEPLTVIDPKAKYALRRKLREIQKTLRMTMIYVTHDQHEALTFADFVTIMKDGKVVQRGSPDDLHSEPANPFVGYFIGSPGMNLIDCIPGSGALDFGDFSIPISPRIGASVGALGSRCLFGIRPECVDVRLDMADGWVPWRVNVVENVGAYKILNLVREKTRLKARVPDTMSVSDGAPVWVRFPDEHVKIFDGDRRVC
jgi:glycerol transport system ATP-binding protein